MAKSKKKLINYWFIGTIAFLVGLTLLWLKVRTANPFFENLNDRHMWDEFLRELIVLGLLVVVWEALHSKYDAEIKRRERQSSCDSLIVLLTFLFSHTDSDKNAGDRQPTPMGRFLRKEYAHPDTKGLQVFSFEKEPLIYGFESVVDRLRDILHEAYREDIAEIYKICWDLHFLNNRHHTLNLLDEPTNPKDAYKLKLNMASIRFSILSRLSKLKDLILKHGIQDGLTNENYILSHSLRERFTHQSFDADEASILDAKRVVGEHKDIAECYAKTFKEYRQYQTAWSEFT